MNRFSFYVLTFLTFLSSTQVEAASSKIREESVRMSSALGPVELLHQQDRFVVSDDEGFHEIDYVWLDSILQKLVKNEEALRKFLDVGTIEIKKDTGGKYLLQSHVKGLGGGPLLAGLTWVAGTIVVTPFAMVVTTTQGLLKPADTYVEKVGNVVQGAVDGFTGSQAKILSHAQSVLHLVTL
jgi:hypothetical protein